MISKELFWEVMKNEIIDKEYSIEFYSLENAFRYWIIEDPQKQSTSKYINIYELAHRCKEWAFNNNEIIISFKYRDEQNPLKWIAETNEDRFRAGTEPEAIFKACEWILKEKR